MPEAPWTLDPIWWITAVELPVLAGLFLLIWRIHRELERELDRLAGGLMDFKLDVAKNYASQAALKETERRLTDHLARIERKLDRFGHLGNASGPD
jgi:hypothetical protein